MNKNNMPMCCLKKSVVNHVGYKGINSMNGRSDIDVNF
jgi:hypothetical protein